MLPYTPTGGWGGEGGGALEQGPCQYIIISIGNRPYDKKLSESVIAVTKPILQNDASIHAPRLTSGVDPGLNPGIKWGVRDGQNLDDSLI